MNYTIHDCEQRSPEWFAVRTGVLTGTAAADMMATIKSGEAAARKNLRCRLALELLTKAPEIKDLSGIAAVQRGVELEPKARDRFEAEQLTSVRQTGFVRHNELLAGASLDGDLDNMSEILEIKCPNSATHWAYIEAGVLPRDYLWQVTHACWLTAAKWVNFVSFDDRFPPGLDYWHLRVPAKDLPLAEYDKAIRAFLREVDEMHQSMKARIK